MNASQSIARFESLESRQLLAAGDIDRSFGTRGVVVLDDDTPAGSLIVLPGGKFLVASGEGTRQFNPDGSPDTSFGGGDGHTPDFGGHIARDAGGKLYAAGSQNGMWLLARFNPDGSRDTSFGNNGRVVVRIGDDHEEFGSRVAIAPSGKIVVAGLQDNDNDDPDNTETPRSDVVVAVFNPDGTPDTSFSGDGESQGLFFNVLHGLAVAPNGNIVVAGQFSAGNDFEAAFFEFDPAGREVDSSIDASATWSTYTAAGYRPDNARVLATSATGHSSVSAGTAFTGVFFRPLDPDRTVDNYVKDVFATSDNKTLVAGFTGFGGRAASGLVRLNPNGSPDKTFGFGGFVVRDFKRRGNDWLNKVAVLPDGDIIAAGYSRSASNAYEPEEGGRLFLARFEGGSRSVGERRPMAGIDPGREPRSGQATFDFNVIYAAEDLIDADTLGDRDVRVFGPKGFRQYASLVGVTDRYGGRQRIATYRIDAPGGAWDAADNGTYRIVLRRRAVRDNFGNATAGRTLQTFAFTATTPPSPGAVPARAAVESSVFSTKLVRDHNSDPSSANRSCKP